MKEEIHELQVLFNDFFSFRIQFEFVEQENNKYSLNLIYYPLHRKKYKIVQLQSDIHYTVCNIKENYFEHYTTKNIYDIMLKEFYELEKFINNTSEKENKEVLYFNFDSYFEKRLNYLVINTIYIFFLNWSKVLTITDDDFDKCNKALIDLSKNKKLFNI